MLCKTLWRLPPAWLWRPTRRYNHQQMHAYFRNFPLEVPAGFSYCGEKCRTASAAAKAEEGEEEEGLQEMWANAMQTSCSWVKVMPSCSEAKVLPQPSVEYFTHILIQCRKAHDRVLALRLYAYMHKNGVAAHQFLGDFLMLMLLEAGNTQIAEQVFDGLVHFTDQSWNSLITAHLALGNPLKALFFYQTLQDDNSVALSRRACVGLLRACAKLKDSGSGLALHAAAARAGWVETDAFVGSALVDMYAKCGLLMIAQEVFNSLSVRDVVSWNSLITGLIKHGCSEEAIACFEQMELRGFSPTSVTFLSILKACSSLRVAGKGRVIHAAVEKMGLLEENVGLGNTLVDMYAKCGLLLDAREVFDKLQVRDVVSWNALMTGYLEHDHDEEALDCFNFMQQDGVFPDAVTCVCSLKACGSLKAVHWGREIHAEVDRKGLLTREPMVGNALVDMYARCGLPFLAHEVLNELSVKETIAWNTLIAGYSEHEYYEEALSCFKEMQLDHHVFPDAATYVCSLKAAGRSGSTEQVLEIHAEVERKTLLESELLIGSTLVDAYSKCGSLRKAQEVFGKLPVRGVVSWTALILGYAEHGHADKALEGFEKMQLDGFIPDAVTYACSLKACGTMNTLGKGQEIHAEVENNGLLDKDLLVASTLVYMYAKCGMLAKAQEVFNKLPVRDIVAWNTLIVGYTEQQQGEQAIKLYDRMDPEGVSASSVTYVCICKACSSIGALDKGEEVHAEISRIGLLKDDLSIGNALVDMYTKFGLLAKAQEVFDGLSSRDIVSWNTLLTGYAEYGYAKEALRCSEQMHLDGVSPNFVTLVCNLKACGSIAASEKGYEVHAEIERRGFFEREASVGASLVDMYVKCGMVAKAQEVFSKILVKDVVTWTALIAGYAEQGFAEDALNCLEQMQFDGNYPDAFTLVWSVKACGSLGATDKGQEIHSEIERKGLLENDVVVGNSLLDMYVKCSMLGKAQQLFDKLPVRDLVSWNSLLVGYTQLGESGHAFCVFDRMLGEGLRPDSVTFTIVLNACSRIGQFDKGQSYLEVMSRDYGMIPSIEHHTCMVDLLCRRGQLHQAISMVEKMSLYADLAVWHVLLTSCTKWGNLKFGKEAFKHAVHLDQQHATAYILMSNLFMAAETQVPRQAAYGYVDNVEAMLLAA